MEVRRSRRGGARLELVTGGRAFPTAGSGHAAHPLEDAIRSPLVERARKRLASGYYGRPEVVERLVELLWDEFNVR